MKLVFRQYLASLRERRELDAVLPDLLSELGYTVLSRPSIGTRQYGVDVAALGPAQAGIPQKLFLFSLKQGDLTRADWDGTPQALRSSINDILDVYIPTRIPPAHRDREIVIVLCFGGEVQEAVRDNLTLFTAGHTSPGLSFEEWNGDHLAGLLVDGILREQLLDPKLRTHFQKAVAMVDEPDVAFKHFAVLIERLCEAEAPSARQRATIMRQLVLCLWVLFVWARDAGNVEAPYRASERAVLHAWPFILGDFGRTARDSVDVCTAFADLVELHFTIWDALIGEKILPHVATHHAVSMAVASSAYADINLKMFELLGRMAMRGLWMLWSEGGGGLLPERQVDLTHPKAMELAGQIAALIDNNPVLLTPIADEQAVDIAVTLLFLAALGRVDSFVRGYLDMMTRRLVFAFRSHDRYPTLHGDYRTLVQHPRERTDGYREAQTKASTLFPLLGIWDPASGATESAVAFAKFAKDSLGHCNFQFWLPDAQTEGRLYRGDRQHGAALSNVPISSTGDEALHIIREETNAASAFMTSSAIAHGHWPIVALACRHYRLPLPPGLWLGVVEALRKARDGDATEQEDAS